MRTSRRGLVLVGSAAAFAAVFVVGVSWGYTAIQATTASGFRAEKEQRLAQNAQRAGQATHSARDVKTPSRRTSAENWPHRDG
jgi:hypothetical protein